MNGDAASALFKLLERYDPFWVAFILAVAILCYKSPEIIKAIRGKK